MVRIRLARRGCKKRPFYHVVVADHEKSRDGRFIEQVGTYDPRTDAVRLAEERIQYWLGVGAQMTPRVRKIAKIAAKS